MRAGHRPCALCRRDAYRAFQAAWAEGQGRHDRPSAGEIDARLHAERIDPATRGKRLHPAQPDDLIPGVMLRHAGTGTVFLLRDPGRLLPWSFAGYGPGLPLTDDLDLRLVTPPSLAAALRAGYRPMLHPSAG